MAKRMVPGVCALCRANTKLCCSHILPEFMYEKSYDEKHQYISLSDHPHRHPRAQSDGAWEHLLCKDCEAKLSVYETYASNLLRSIDAIEDIGQDQETVEYEYPAFKLFGLSLIWRSHIAKHHEYRKFSVGPIAEDLRHLLLTGEPGPPRTCPFSIARILGSEAAQRTIHVPAKIRQRGQHLAFFPAFGYWWYFVVSRRSHTVPAGMPLVGFTPQLCVLFERTSDARFLKWLKTKLTPELLS